MTIKDKIKAQDYDAADEILSDVNPLNVIEENSKTAHAILKQMKSNPNLPLTNSIIAEATTVAEQTVIEGGIDVYLMRTLLNLNIVDDLDNTINQRLANNEALNDFVNKDGFTGKIYPNPSSGEVYWKFRLMSPQFSGVNWPPFSGAN